MDKPAQSTDVTQSSDQRRYPRLDCGGAADLRVLPNGEKETGSLINLSKRGCCFIADAPLRGVEGSRIEVHLKVRGIDLRVAGVIRHLHKGIRAGIEFVALSDRKCKQIDELLEELTRLEILAEQVRAAALAIQDAETHAAQERKNSRERRYAAQDRVRARVLRF